MHSAICSIVGLVLVLTTAGTATAAEPNQPNIVVFLSDDMGWGQPGFQGGAAAPTPNIDRLAQEGVCLTQFYTYATCTPTRAAFLTGRYAFRTGTEERVHANDTAGMLTDERTLAEALRDAGYATAIFGKWHLGEWQKQHLPMQRGFDHQYGHYGALIDSFLKMRGGVYDWHRNEQPLDEEGYSTFLIADEFQRVLRQHDASGPFFYYVPFNAVHGPHQAPAEYVAKHGGNAQLAQLECMDIAIGRMIGALESKGVLDETLILFFNDNGGTRRVGNAPYRGTKKETFEGGVRVACVLRWPGQLPAGQRRQQLVHVTDLYPTLIRVAGGSVEQPLPVDGVDVWETIVCGAPSPRNEVVYSLPGLAEAETGQPAIRLGDYKLVDDQLYNISEDPYETQDLAGRHPEIVRQLAARLQHHAAQRRPQEEHVKVPGERPWIRGEQENRQYPPAWYRQLPFDEDQTLKEERATPERQQRRESRQLREASRGQ